MASESSSFAFPLTPLASDQDLDTALRAIDLLSSRDLEPQEAVTLNALIDLVSAYEEQHYAIPPPSEADMLQHLLESRSVSLLQLSADSRIPLDDLRGILNGTMSLCDTMVCALAAYFRIHTSVLTGCRKR